MSSNSNGILESKVVLAIESAISGGSLAILRDGAVIAGWTGMSNVSRAEDLLPMIDLLLAANDIRKSELNLIAVSAGPGSFTGIRIGLATALGLKAGLGIKLASVSALEAMAAQQQVDIIVAVPVGRNAVCMQPFDVRAGEAVAADHPKTVVENVFLDLIADRTDTTFILHRALFDRTDSPNAIDFGANIASAVGRLCSVHPDTMVEPLFVSKSF